MGHHEVDPGLDRAQLAHDLSANHRTYLALMARLLSLAIAVFPTALLYLSIAVAVGAAVVAVWPEKQAPVPEAPALTSESTNRP